MLPTPDTSHVAFTNIYTPSEDTFFLLDTLSSSTEISFLTARFPKHKSTPLILEVGTGSGVVLAFATAQARHIFGRADILALGVDINRHACSATIQTVTKAVAANDEQGIRTSPLLAAVTASLTSAVRDGMVDILLFNPPYVPSEDVPALPECVSAYGAEKDSLSKHLVRLENNALLALATDGGPPDGMAITTALLSELPRVLSDRGVAYVLLCARNRPATVRESILAWNIKGTKVWNCEVVGESGGKGGWERLVILRIWRTTDDDAT